MATQILVVDDSSLIRKLVETVLSQAGYQVHTASSGPDALRQVMDTQLNLVILDVTMPEMDGYEVCRRLRQNPHTAHLPIMMLTSLDSLENKLKGFEAGADDYMIKPFQGAELCARIEALLRRPVVATSPAVEPIAKVIATFSLRGGVGVSTLAANLAVGLAQIWEHPTVLVDLALTAGQAALMLNLPLRHTWTDLGKIPIEEIDADLLDRSLLRHSSRVGVLAAPRRPEDSSLITADKIAHTLAVLSKSYPYIVLDLPHDFQDTSLTGLDAAHQIIALLAPDLASVRAMACTLDVFDMLKYPAERIQMVLNNTFERHGLPRKDIEATLKRTVDLEIPFAADVFVRAVNQGIPPIIDANSSSIGSLLEDYAFDVSQEGHKAEQPESPTPAWKRVVRRVQKRQTKR
jgi:pilus assembly protein CpaE